MTVGDRSAVVAGPEGGAGPDTGPDQTETTTRAVAAGDTSHCVGDRQTDLIENSPPCVPAFGGNNGGATYPGVTGDTIKLIRFNCTPNEQVDAILATQGLAATKQETDDMVQASIDWMNETYEFYGRELVHEHVVGDCTLTPPDPARSRQAAAEVAKKQPAFIIHDSGGSTTHDTWSQNGIVSLGGPTQANEFFAGRRPFRWDVFPNGTETADWIAEYTCKKLAGNNASNAGQLIHPTIGGRNTPQLLEIVRPSCTRARLETSDERGQVEHLPGDGLPPLVVAHVRTVSARVIRSLRHRTLGSRARRSALYAHAS